MLESIETKTFLLADETATMAFGKWLALKLSFPCIIFLQGDLGAGKTTLIRGFLRGLGYTESVKSPTYTLVEEYDFGDNCIYHFDLYRISHPEELESIGMREYFHQNAIVFIEWPENGEGFLPGADLLLTLKEVPEGRKLSIQYLTEKIAALKIDFSEIL